MLDFFRVTPKKRIVKIKAKSGIIYHNPPIKKKAIFLFGNVLFFVAVGYFIYLYWPLSKAMSIYFINKNQLFGTRPIIYTVPQPSVDKTDFSIQIPRIFAASKIAAEVSPFDKNEYLKVLNTNEVAQAKGSSFPGEGLGKTTYIFAHSTQQGIGAVRKNSVFYLLGELQKNDPIFVKYNGKVYIYKVYKQIVVDPSQIEYLTYSEKDKEILLLQTCWPIGTDWRRLLVFAQLAN
jgi:LPXTG-site transpeptidase (sortase) family protein